MTTNIATTKEQSARLLQCGVDPETADMFYTNYRTKPNDETPIIKTVSLGIRKDLIPAWSLSALLALLPKRIKRGDCTDYTLNLSCDGFFWDLEYTYARYCGEDDSLVLLEDADPIKTCVQLIEWLTANNYKLNEL